MLTSVAYLLTNLQYYSTFLPCKYTCTRTDWHVEELLQPDPKDFGHGSLAGSSSPSLYIWAIVWCFDDQHPMLSHKWNGPYKRTTALNVYYKIWKLNTIKYCPHNFNLQIIIYKMLGYMFRPSRWSPSGLVTQYKRRRLLPMRSHFDITNCETYCVYNMVGNKYKV
jgi:hypothetical protein